MTRCGQQSWLFSSAPVLAAAAAVGGPFEAKGPLARDFDILYEDIWLGQESVEKAERKMLEEACDKAIAKGGKKKEDVHFFLSGDLMNQIISSNFAARTLALPYLGLFGACSSSMEGLALAALLVDSKAADVVLAATSSHNVTAEKQYRYPSEYGAQKPPTAQWTVTGAGAGLVTREGMGPKITCATIGRVIDMGIGDPFNLGAAMAPAAVDTIMAHFRDLKRAPSYYDIIATGDLGRVGHQMAVELLKERQVEIAANIFTDCGIIIYGKDQPVFSGGSGCACSAVVTYGHFYKGLCSGMFKKVLIVATGALLSPLSYQQKESIPAIAHAVALEM